MRSFWDVLEIDFRKLETYWLLFSAPVLLLLYRYNGYPEYFRHFFPGLAGEANFELYSRFWQFGVFFILLLVVPLISTRFFTGLKLSSMGLGVGDFKLGMKLFAFLFPLIILPVLYFAVDMPEIQSEYPLAKIIKEHHDLIFIYELFYVIFYYFAWEFFFRGFLLFGLKPRIGAFNAVLIQTISSSLIHIGKPGGEVIGSIIVGILFGVIALRTRSIWYVFLLHAAIGVATDLLIIFK